MIRVFAPFAVVLTALAICPRTAIADPVTLICDRHLPLDDGPATIELNEAQGTAVVHNPSITNGSAGLHQAGSSIGPLHATFTPQEVTFSDTSNGTLDTYVINRLSASVAETQNDLQDHHLAGYANWTCQVGKAQF